MEEWQDLGAKTKTQALRERLTEISHSLGAGARFPTINEMTSSFRVSVSTLDRILAELEHDGIIERKRGRGIYVSSKSSKKLIGIVCDLEIGELLNTFYAGMITRSLQGLLEDAGYDCHLFIDLRPDQDGIPRNMEFYTMVERGSLSGVCYIGGFCPKMIEWIQEKIPATLVLGASPNAKHKVYLDYPALCRLGTREAIRLGVKSPVLLPYWDMDGDLFKACGTAFSEELSAAGIKLEPGMVWRSGLTIEIEANEAQGYRAVMELFKRPGKTPDAIISIDDMTTRGAIAALGSLGLSIGQDITIVSHVNKGSPSLDLFRKQLSLVEVDLDMLASNMILILNKVINGDNSPSFSVMSCAKIVPRKSLETLSNR